MLVALAACAVLLLAVGHIMFGLENFRPGYPRGEGVASIIAGVALLISLVTARWSVFRALVTACLGTLPLVAWFAYAVPVERSSTPVFLWLSLVVPVTAACAALVLRRTRRR